MATQTETVGPLGSGLKCKAQYSVDKTVLSQENQELGDVQKKRKERKKEKKIPSY